jgi:sterol desaturase/sphingolipid hydroxylase (fatty acid hydroxylase superfamily)
MLNYTKRQFDLFCCLFATYLFVHFAQLLPHAAEVFSSDGMIKDPSYLPTAATGGVNILFHYDSPRFVTCFILALMASAIAIGVGFFRRTSAAILFYGWICLLNRNPFTSNPSMPYIGWLLLVTMLTPRNQEGKTWRLSSDLYYGAWIVMGVSYTASGFHKLFLSPSWIDGTALHHVLTGALARNNWSVWIFLNVMPSFVLKFMTWLSLFAEISFLFLGCFHHLRRYYWTFFMGFHLGILAMINFSDLTLGMMMIHIFTFDMRWVADFVEDYKKLRTVFNGKSKPAVEDNGDDGSNGSNESNGSNGSTGSTASGEADAIEFNYWLLQASVIVVFFAWFLVYQQERTISEIVDRMTQISMDMTWGLAIIGGVLALLMVLERKYPHFELHPVGGWWKWIVAIYGFQGLSVIVATFTWEHWLQETSYFKSANGFHLRDHVNPFIGGFLAYVFNTWVFYWWHLARHRVYLLWVLTHQMHHSATRLETITSFYKHPLEIVIDSQIIAIISYSVLGMSPESSIWVSIFSAMGEYIYHMNLRTPKWLGYFFQRPESHRLHHRKNARLNCPNYADLPLWDMLNNTFDNPDPDYFEETGFPNREDWRWSMMFFVDVLKPGRNTLTYPNIKHAFKKGLIYLLILWGAANSVAFMCHDDSIRGVGFSSVSSPLPLVFSAYQGVETFSTTFELQTQLQNGTLISQPMDSVLYSKIGGAYNRRNVYGALFSHGPFFDEPNMIHLRDEILHYGVCEPGVLMEEFGIHSKPEWFEVTIRSKSIGENRSWKVRMDCTESQDGLH